MPQTYGYEVDRHSALGTLRRFFTGPFNFLDTSNNYGAGRAETLIGEALRDIGGLPSGFVLATKVDADPVTGDFSGARVRRSVEESFERLGIDRVQLLHLHDPDLRTDFAGTMRAGGAVDALRQLKEEGLAANIGVATGDVGILHQYLSTQIFDVILNHNHYTLVDRAAESLIAECARRGVGFLNAAPYGGGMLAKGPAAQPRYAYARASEATTRMVEAMARTCDSYGVPLAAAALHYSLRDRRIASTVIGVSGPKRIEETLALAAQPIPDALMQELDAVRADHLA
jgi:D-threo-aldose 1-dehydrogenase